jgi:hypothetical protein
MIDAKKYQMRRNALRMKLSEQEVLQNGKQIEMED